MKNTNRRILLFSLATAVTTAATSLLAPGALAAAVPDSGDVGEASVAMVEKLEETFRKADLSGINLSIPTTFNITRPTQTLTTSYSSYFITGTSDPSQPLYMGSTEVNRLGTQGTFGVHVTLQAGTNTFTFSQGGESQTVTIIRSGQAGTAAISDIRQASMYPSTSGGVRVGKNLPVECVAPSGATVSATFEGVTVNLTQSSSASAGQPVTFTGRLPVNSAPKAGETTKVGPVTYNMSYSGKSKTYQSSGNVYVAGENSRIAVQVTSYAGFVYFDTNNNGNFKEKLKVGAVDYVKAENNDWFELSSGGYIQKGQATILEGKAKLSREISGVSLSTGSKGETVTFSGINCNAYVTHYADGKFHITFFNASGTPAPNVGGSSLFSGVSVKDNDGSVTYSFSVKNVSKLWGYNISYDKKAAKLDFKYKPTLSGGSQPLSGVTILLDPGHGGPDPGAFGLAGATGPTEKDVNLAHAYVIKDELERQGAKVVLSRKADTELSLDDRLKAIEAANADIFLSVHHNSLVESVNANTVSGLEIYYHDPLSAGLAGAMMNGLVNGTGRSRRTVQQSYYRVTLMPHSPAILMELGFMSNPVEYERAANASEMQKVAEAVADGVKRALQ